MDQYAQNNKYIPIKILVISCLVIFLLFAWQGNKGLNLWDEGWLWYGVQRVLLGEVPLLDFMSYDPGRYYWSAALLSLAGEHGIMSLRVVVAIFQALGLFVGLLLIAQSAKNERNDTAIFWLASAAILAVWMFPRHKLFDISLSIFLIGILTFLIKKPIPIRYILAGAGVGLIAVFGRNHGMYGAAGSLGVIAWLSLRNSSDPGFLKGFALWGIGVVVGFLPIIFMTLLIPGFANAFWESVRFLFEQKTTNIPLPVPWPWTVSLAATSLGDTARSMLVSIFFMSTLVFGMLAILWVIYQKLKERPVPSVLVAAAFLTLPYAHHAFSRADVGHLAQGIFPFLVGCLTILSTVDTKIKWPLTVGLGTASFWVMLVFHPGWKCLVSTQCVDIKVSGSTLHVEPNTANDVALLREWSEQYAPNGQNFIVAPFWPGAYALLERKSPMWENFALYHRTEVFENKEIERIKESNPGFAFILDHPLDGRDELRFKNTHPLIHKYILDNFDPAPSPSIPEYQIYKSRRVEQ